MSESLGATRSHTTAFGAALRSMRLAAGLSQGALAERAGLGEKAVGALERGDRASPRLATLGLLADALGASQAERDRLAACRGTRRAATDRHRCRVSYSARPGAPSVMVSIIAR
ncbi:MAG: helix-turn-helix domain-containing protein [Chloroflexi bacterium]|nr:helix-turn-helix domain-containing protein [Chloroflexota bacterium]